MSSTHQSDQFSDNANTEAETADGGVGRVPAFRLWNAQVSWTMRERQLGVVVGLNNIADRRYFTRNVDSNQGRMVGRPRTIYIRSQVAF